MIKSMTGYGKAVAVMAGKKITIEVKSLNSKQLDLNIKLPWLYKEKETELRNLISQELDRGKIDLNVYFDVLDNEIVPVINKAVVRSYYDQLTEISRDLGIETSEQLLSSILRLPDALKTEKPELDENEWNQVSKGISEALNSLNDYRAEEGKSIEADLARCIGRIETYLSEVEQFEGERISRIRERLKTLLAENIGTENIDKNRFEQELIFYLDKLDINEEKVRLRKHCEYFTEKLAAEPPNGKILSFIAQEIGREINTIGSKANDASIQKLVVMMKDELEKVKEQTLNVL
jgi:uncharacterized protein (TIGR00255 family)